MSDQKGVCMRIKSQLLACIIMAFVFRGVLLAQEEAEIMTKEMSVEEPEINEPKEAITDKEREEEPKGFDTVSVSEPEGNWLLKRWWWEKAQKRYEKIKTVVSRIIDSRMIFFKKRNDIERNVFDPFYNKVGLDQGQLEEVVSHLTQKLEQEREEQMGLTGKERDFLATLTSEKRMLKQMQLDIDAIRKLDEAIDDDLEKLMDQINLSRKYEETAWQIFKGISKQLNHEEARKLYYKMKTLWQNIKDIDGYIKGVFTNHFNSVIENANRQVSRIQDAAAAFKAKGVDLNQQYEQIEAEERGFRKPSDQVKGRENKELQEDDDDDDEQEIEVGFLGTIWNIITWPFRIVWNLISSLWR